MSADANLLRNTAFSVAPQLTSVLVALLLSPYIVAKVGLAAFGFWSIVLAVVAYAQVADGGFPTLATRHIAAAHTSGDIPAMRAVMVMTNGALAIVGLLVVGIVVAVTAAVPTSSASSLPDGWRAAAICGAVAFAVTTFGKGLASVSHGHHRWAVEAVVAPSSLVTGALATVAFLSAGSGIAGLGYAAVITSATALIGYGWSAHQLVGLRPRGARPNRVLWKDFRRQGINLQLVTLVNVTNGQADRFFLAAFAPLSFIGAYALGARMAVAIRSFPASAFGPLIAHLSGTYQSAGLAAVGADYTRTFRAVANFGLAGLFVVYGALYPGVLAWLGSDFRISATAGTLLGIGYAVNILTGPGTGAAVACGRAELDRDYSLIGLGLNIVLTLMLGLLVGPWGVVVATTVALSLSSLWLLRAVDRWLGVSWLRAVRTAQSGAVNVPLGLFIGAATLTAAAVVPPLTRIEYLGIAALGCSTGAVLLGGRSATRFVRLRVIRRRAALD